MPTTTNAERIQGNKNERIKFARETINKKIPVLLASDTRARDGTAQSMLFRHLAPISKLQDYTDPTVRVWHTDTISAVWELHKQSSTAIDRFAILNMASPLRPGGGVLTGATSQEEFLCLRTTLYPSLKDEFYRLPETGLIYTKDVLVFRDGPGVDLPKSGQFHIDVVTAAMLRFPDVAQNEGKLTWAVDSDRELVLTKMRMVMRALVVNGVTKVVLGAWGCGAYANPVEEIAQCWKRVLLGPRRKEDWKGVVQVVFAITTKSQVEVFKRLLERCSICELETGFSRVWPTHILLSRWVTLRSIPIFPAVEPTRRFSDSEGGGLRLYTDLDLSLPRCHILGQLSPFPIMI